MEHSINDSAARRYLVDELLDMQTSLHVVICAVKHIKYPDVAVVFRLPDEALKNPERFTCETNKLADTRNKTPRPARKELTLSSADSEYPLNAASLRQPKHIHWSLRQREGTDRSSQPYSAPSGLAAQQSENFQRFYRAVVSPTHVRVTAGGRIVPNTRTTASPVLEWNGEKLYFEPKRTPQDDQTSSQGIAWPQQSQNTQLPLGFPPALANGLLPLPFGFLSQSNPVSLQNMALQPPASFAGGEFKPPDAGQSTMNKEQGSLPHPIKISPPSQFDQSKPFMINGQLVYPVPPGFQPPSNALPLPFTMIGNPSFLQGQSQPPTGFFPPQFPMALANMPHPFMFPHGAPPPIPMQEMGQGHQFIPQGPPLLPLPGIIPLLSDMTRNQIRGLQNHLKFVESQIANNKGQDNEAFFVGQHDQVQSQINTMQQLLHKQLEQENGSRQEIQKANIAEDHNCKSSSTVVEDNIASTKVSSALPIVSPPTAVKSDVQYPNIAMNKSEDVHTDTTSTQGKSRSLSKSRLSAAAAMAPPFQPRVQPPVQTPSLQPSSFSRFAYTPPTEPTAFNSQTNHENRPAVAHASLSRAQTLHEVSLQDATTNVPASFNRANTFHGGQFAALVPLNPVAISSPQAPQGVPYLIGILPSGVPANTATPQDLIYSRPLTDEEVRARYLYWGKAPRHVQSGLPKFDGKDFYPPSPVKDYARLSKTTHFASSKTTPRMPLPDFESLFTEPEAKFGYKTPSPARCTSTVQVGIPTPKQPFAENGTGHRAPTCSANFTTGQPETPPLPILDASGELDYSLLFMERGKPGFKSPTPPRSSSQKTLFKVGHGTVGVPVTPENLTSDFIERESTRTPEEAEAPSPVGNSAQSDASTVEIHLSSDENASTDRIDNDIPFAERVANFNPQQQTLFLHNFLKNNPTVSGTAVSGSVSSATAQGYLPHYRGAAAASLSPVVSNSEPAKDMPSSASQANSSKENRPLSYAIPIVRPPAASDAETYMRYVQEKQKVEEEKKKTVVGGWNPNTTGTGPIMGSDW